MTFKEAVDRASSYPKNDHLQWFVCKWNDGYIIHSSTHMNRFPNIPYVWSTLSNEAKQSKEESRYKHTITKGK